MAYDPLQGYPSIYVDGWFGGDGASLPSDGVYAGGWYAGAQSIEDVSTRLDALINFLRVHKPVYINTDGRLAEMDVMEIMA